MYCKVRGEVIIWQLVYVNQKALLVKTRKILVENNVTKLIVQTLTSHDSLVMSDTSPELPVRSYDKITNLISPILVNNIHKANS